MPFTLPNQPISAGATRQASPPTNAVQTIGHNTVYAPPPSTVRVLRDSNPATDYRAGYGVGSNSAFRDLLGGKLAGALGGGMNNAGMGGYILGSSVGPPAAYGAGLTPASGLGGGLYPSLVSLYR